MEKLHDEMDIKDIENYYHKLLKVVYNEVKI